MKNKALIILFLPLLALAKPTLLVDMGGVLVDTNKLETFKRIGATPLINYFRAHPWLLLKPHQISTHLKNRLFQVLTAVDPVHTCAVFDERGNRLPPVMCQWLVGSTSNATIIAQIERYFADHPTVFESPAEQALLTAMIHTIFNPEIFAELQYFIPGAKKFIRYAIQKGFDVIILSNWDKETFTIFKERHASFFAQCKDIILSADLGVCKPDLAIYRHAINKHQLVPRETYHIDNQVENIAAAATVDIDGFLVRNNNIAAAYQFIDELVTA